MHRRQFVTTLGFALGAASLGAARAAPGDDRLYDAGLALPPGPAGRCDDARVGGPVVRWDARANAWRLWYYGRDRNFPAGLAPAFGSGNIATATSKDGLRWTRVDGPLRGGAVMVPSTEDGAFDTTHLATGDVLWHAGEWLMVYHGGNRETPRSPEAEFAIAGNLLRVGLARSPDGVNWTRVRGSATGGAIVEVPDGDVYAGFPNFLHDGRRFLLYFTTVDLQGRFYRTRVASSTDLRAWSFLGDLEWLNEPEPWEGGGVITRDMLPNPLGRGPRWLMVYTGKDGRHETNARRSIGTAVSDDGLRWKRLHDRPIFQVGPHGSWDSAGVANPRLVATPTDMRLYYYGWSDAGYSAHPARGIGCAVAPGRELFGFRRLKQPA